MKILVLGPSPKKSKGGMATVIQEIKEDIDLNKKFDINILDSYIDGNIVIRLLFSIYAYLKFLLFYTKYDLYHIHMASYGSAFRKAKYINFLKKRSKKVIVHIHGAAFLVFFEGLKESKKQYIVDTLNLADMVIALSDKWKEEFESKLGLKNCVTLNNGIDTEKYCEAIVNPEKCQKSFVALGRLGQRKGTYDLVEAVERAQKTVPDIKVYLAGDGEVDKVKELVRARNLTKNIEIVGWVDYSKKIELLKRVSTVVLPSYNEGLPMAILEGMACGKAIISTTVGAIPEVVQSENGIIIDPGDILGLEKALVSCSQNTEMIRLMSKENIKKIDEEFSMKIMHQKLESYYNEVLKGGV